MFNPKVFAHRGASGKCFENTMSAFLEAYKQGTDGIELDVQLTEDGVPIVIHDADLRRLAGVSRKINSMTYAEIKKTQVGKKFIRSLFGHSIPTLLEVVAFCETYGISLNVELKETISERPESINDIISMLSDVKDVHISSFDYNLIQKVKKIDSRMETAFLVRKKGVDWNNLHRYIHADGFHLHKKLITEPYINKLIDTGKKIRVYAVTGIESITLNPPSYIDGWITDFPGEFIKRRTDIDN
jgi:glycerophosphoryl diester phosphodiesterase